MGWLNPTVDNQNVTTVTVHALASSHCLWVSDLHDAPYEGMRPTLLTSTNDSADENLAADTIFTEIWSTQVCEWELIMHIVKLEYFFTHSYIMSRNAVWKEKGEQSTLKSRLIISIKKETRPPLMRAVREVITPRIPLKN